MTLVDLAQSLRPIVGEGCIFTLLGPDHEAGTSGGWRFRWKGRAFAAGLTDDGWFWLRSGPSRYKVGTVEALHTLLRSCK